MGWNIIGKHSNPNKTSRKLNLSNSTCASYQRYTSIFIVAIYMMLIIPQIYHFLFLSGEVPNQNNASMKRKKI